MHQRLGRKDDIRSRIERLVELPEGVAPLRHERKLLADIAYDHWRHLRIEDDPTDDELDDVIRPIYLVWSSMRKRKEGPWQGLWKILRHWAYCSTSDLRVIAILCTGEHRRPGEVDKIVLRVNLDLPTDEWKRQVAATLIAEAGRDPDILSLIEAARLV